MGSTRGGGGDGCERSLMMNMKVVLCFGSFLYFSTEPLSFYCFLSQKLFKASLFFSLCSCFLNGNDYLYL